MAKANVNGQSNRWPTIAPGVDIGQSVVQCCRSLFVIKNTVIESVDNLGYIVSGILASCEGTEPFTK